MVFFVVTELRVLEKTTSEDNAFLFKAWGHTTRIASYITMSGDGQDDVVVVAKPKSVKKKKKVAATADNAGGGQDQPVTTTTKKKKTAKKKQSIVDPATSSTATTSTAAESSTCTTTKPVKKKKKKRTAEEGEKQESALVPVSKPPGIQKKKSVAKLKKTGLNDSTEVPPDKPKSIRSSSFHSENGGRGRGSGGRGRMGRGYTIAGSYRNINNGGGGNAGVRRPQSMTAMSSSGHVGTKGPQSTRMGMSDHGNRHPPPGGRGGNTNRPMSMANLGGGRGGKGRGGRGLPPTGRQPSIRKSGGMGGDLPFESPYESDDNLSDDAPPPKSRRESAPPPSSYRAPNKPQSILRTSSHHDSVRGGILGNSSHRTNGYPRQQPSSRKIFRSKFDGSISSGSMHFTDSGEDDSDDDRDGSPRKLLDRTPSMIGSMHSRGGRPSLADTRSGGSFAMRDAWQSFRRPTLSKYTSARSVLTFDMEFEDEPNWKQFLRYIRILPPHKDEKPIKRRIRIFTWVAMFLDFLAALVSITTYDGVSMCCGEPVLSIAGDINWTLAVRITTYLYMILIFAEIVPVLRGGFPFNLLNPFVGFCITFAVFFDDRILEAVIMWLIEASAVACEFFVYRLRVRVHSQREARLQETEEELKAIKQSKRKLLSQLKSGKSSDDSSDEDSFAGGSFHDETTDSDDPMPDVSQVRETRLLRERRLLRQTQSEDRRHLRYHFIGVAVNGSLAGIALMLICSIGRSGGLCVRDMVAPNVFKNDQLERCYDCQGTTGVCEVCREDGTSHCYYPYF